MSEKALFDENLTKEHRLAYIIRTKIVGIDPDEQEVRLDDSDWNAILSALDALEWYGEQARLCRLIHSEGDVGRHALSNDGGRLAREAMGLVGAK